MNSQNLYNSQHKAANSKSRAGHDSINWQTKKRCWRCDGEGRVLVMGKREESIVSCTECG